MLLPGARRRRYSPAMLQQGNLGERGSPVGLEHGYCVRDSVMAIGGPRARHVLPRSTVLRTPMTFFYGTAPARKITNIPISWRSVITTTILHSTYELMNLACLWRCLRFIGNVLIWTSSLWGMPSINAIISFVIADVCFQASPLFHR